jgi:endonuclease G
MNSPRPASPGSPGVPPPFCRDDALPGAAFDSDYRHSGYSRGHLVPASDQAFSPEAIAATFLLSNAVPMPVSLNAGRWRQLENAVRRLASRSGRVIVFTGPVFCTGIERIGETGLAGPCRLFKVVLANRDGRSHAYADVIPNTDNPPEPLESFAVSVDTVEQFTRLDLFPKLPPEIQESLESTVTAIPRHW